MNDQFNIPHSRSNDSASTSATFPIRSQPTRSLSPFRQTRIVSDDDGDDVAMSESQSSSRTPSTSRSPLRSAALKPVSSIDSHVHSATTTSDANAAANAIPNTLGHSHDNIVNSITSVKKSETDIHSNSQHSTKSTGSSEDEVVKQAREAALQAAQQIKKTAHHTQSAFHISLPQIQLGPNGLSLQTKQQEKQSSMIVGDMQQRKLIEQKLKQHELLKIQKEKEKQEKEKEILIEPFKQISEKLEGFIQESQQKIDDMMHHQKKAHNHPNDNESSSSGDEGTKDKNRVRQILSLPGQGQNDEESLSAIVWKRRSGYGKYSATKAWEKRKIVLRGSVIQYFKVMESEKNEASISADPSHSRPSSPLDSAMGSTNTTTTSPTSHAASASTSPTITTDVTSSKPKKNFWDEAKENLTKAQENIKKNILHPNHNTDTSSSGHSLENGTSKYDTPRGQIDLIGENAIVAAMNNADAPVGSSSGGQNTTNAPALESNSTSFTPSSILHSVNITNYAPSLPHSTPPTPFGITIMVKNESTAKWKICFLSQKEQMEWLTLLTSVIVSKSVDVCNQGLLQKFENKGKMKDRGNGMNTRDMVDTMAEGSGITRTEIQMQNNEEHKPLWKMEEQYSMGTLIRAASSVGSTTAHNNILTSTQSASKDDDMDINSSKLNEDESITTKVEGDPGVDDSPLAILQEYICLGSTTGPNLCIARTNLCVLMAVYNMCLFIIMSVESRVTFRFMVILINLIMGILVVEEGDNEEHDSKGSVTKKKTRTKRINPLLVYLKQYQNGDKANELTKTKTGLKPTHVKPKSTIPAMTKKNSSKPLAQDSAIQASTKSPPISRGIDFRPVAGSSMRRMKESEVTLTDNLLRWSPLSCDEVMIRSHGYLKSRKKIGSPGSIYEIIAADALMDDARVAEIMANVQLPTDILQEFEQIREADGERTWHSPDFFVASIAIPTDEPSLTRPTTDGGGLTCAVYYKMKKETREILKRITAPDYDPEDDPDLNNPSTDAQTNLIPAIRLWEEYCRTAPHDEKMQGRFKLIPNIHNPREVGLPSWISKYCGKPVLIKRKNVTGFLSSHPHLHAMEFDITLHPFPYLAKKAMAYLYSSVFVKAIVSLAYVVEGRDDDELPEMVIGDGLRLMYPDPALLCNANDFFKGIGKSFENGLRFLSTPESSLKTTMDKTGGDGPNDIDANVPLDANAGHGLKGNWDPTSTVEDLDGVVDTGATDSWVR